jgi:adenylate cyclase
MSTIEPPAAYFKELDERGKVIQLWPLKDATSFFVGRADNNTISLPYSWVSRKHAMVRLEDDGGLTLIDLGSSNGTFINGKRISIPTQLRSKDLIRIGKTLLTFIQNDYQSAETLPGDLTADKTVVYWQREIVTILICDINDFTTLSEKLDTQTLSDILQYWSGGVSKMIKNHNGIIDKFIGDAVLAMWVGSTNHRQSIRQALQTALEINYFTRTINKEIFDLPWELSIGSGMNTGEAALGNVGISGQRDFTAVGDAVNVAFRLEGLTSKQDGRDIIIGEDTAKQYVDISNKLTSCEYRLKGKELPVKSYCCSFNELENFLSTTSS